MRHRLTGLTALLVCGVGFHAPPCASPSGPADGIVAPGAKLEKLWSGGVVLTEGVAVAPDGMVYFSDITFTHASKDKHGVAEAGHIWKFDPKTQKATIFRSP